MNDLATPFPLIAATFDTLRYCGLTASDITHGSRTDHYWVCQNGHSHTATPFKKSAGTHVLPSLI